MRDPAQDDIDSAAWGLNMVSKSPAELEQMMRDHSLASEFFASRVIHLAAKQMLQVKRRNGAE